MGGPDHYLQTEELGVCDAQGAKGVDGPGKRALRPLGTRGTTDLAAHEGRTGTSLGSVRPFCWVTGGYPPHARGRAPIPQRVTPTRWSPHPAHPHGVTPERSDPLDIARERAP